MATPKKARVTRIEKWNPDVSRISCELLGGGELGFIGGQYVIVNSGRLLPNGKLGKRAYSIPTSDASQYRFDLIVKKIPGGVGSGFIHDLKKEDEFEFSGPWGQYKACELSSEEQVLCIATDTGITAALGLLRSKRLASSLSQAKLIWFLPGENYFIPPTFVRSALEKEIQADFPVWIPETGNEMRASACLERIEKEIGETRFSKIYLSGDGLLLRDLHELFSEKGYSPDQVFMESFFNHEVLKAPSAQRA